MATDLSYSAAFRQGVSEEMERDNRVFVTGTDLYHRGGHFAQVLGLGEIFGEERIRDAPISECAIIAAGVGSALMGMRPIVDLNFIDFAFGAMDEIVNQAAKMRYMADAAVPMVIRASAGVALGGPQHNNIVDSWFAAVPGLTVVSPATAWDAKALIKTAIRHDDPVVFLMHKKLSGIKGTVGGTEELLPFGRAAVRREGNDCTLIGYGGLMPRALEAAEILATEGVQTDVIDLRSLQPLDLDTILASVRKTGRAVTIDESPGFGSIASEVSTVIHEHAFEYLDNAVVRVTAARTPVGASPLIVDAAIPLAADIAAGVRRALRPFESRLAVRS